MARKNKDTSIEAYHSLDPIDLGERFKKILAALLIIKEGTFEDIASYLKVEKSTIWKRLSEMERMGQIHRPGHKKKMSSGRNGYVWTVGKAPDPKSTTQRKKRTYNGSKVRDRLMGGLFS